MCLAKISSKTFQIGPANHWWAKVSIIMFLLLRINISALQAKKGLVCTSFSYSPTDLKIVLMTLCTLLKNQNFVCEIKQHKTMFAYNDWSCLFDIKNHVMAIIENWLLFWMVNKMLYIHQKCSNLSFCRHVHLTNFLHLL